MSNSIEHNRRKSDNQMPGLSFYWIAEFENDSIFQFENGVEHRFQEVLDKLHDLKYFTLQHQSKELNFTVDLERGLIFFNNFPSIENKEIKKNCRLIHFRRNRVEIGEADLQVKSHNIEYHLGYQYNTADGKNRQVILIIDEEGNWVLEA